MTIQYAVSGTKETAMVLNLECTYQVSYLIPEDTQLDEDEIRTFGSTTALLTLHPYLRELFADVSVRAGLPLITLGSVRLHLGAA